MISCLLAELVLREVGWAVRNLGMNLPLRSLAQATIRYQPRLVFLSVNFLRDSEQFIREYMSFYETASWFRVAVIVGGQALGPDIRTRLAYTAFGDRMINLAEFARHLTSSTSMAGAAPAVSSQPSIPVPETSEIPGEHIVHSEERSGGSKHDEYQA